MLGLYEWRDPRAWLAALIGLLISGYLISCAATNPVARAETAEQRAFAIYGTFVIFSEKAADLVESGTLSDDVSLRVIGAEERAKPIADSLLDATLEFVAVREEFESGATSEERFVQAANSLNDWVTRATPLINNLANAVRGEL